MACRMRRSGGCCGPPVEGTLPDFPFSKHSSIKGGQTLLASGCSLTLIWYVLVIGCPQQQFRFDIDPCRDRNLPMVGTESRNRNLAQYLLKRHQSPFCQRGCIRLFSELRA